MKKLIIVCGFWLMVSNGFCQQKAIADAAIVAGDVTTAVELGLLANDLVHNAEELLRRLTSMEAKLAMIKNYCDSPRGQLYFNVDYKVSLNENVKLYSLQIGFVGRGLKELLRLISTTLEKHALIVSQSSTLKATDQVVSPLEAIAEEASAAEGNVVFGGAKRKIEVASTASEFRMKAEQAVSTLQKVNIKIIDWYKSVENLDKDLSNFFAGFGSDVSIMQFFTLNNYYSQNVVDNRNNKLKVNGVTFKSYDDYMEYYRKERLRADSEYEKRKKLLLQQGE